MKKLILVSALCVLLTLFAGAQNASSLFAGKEIMGMYMMQKDFGKAVDMAERVYAKSQLTEDDIQVLGLGAYVYSMHNDNENARRLANRSIEQFLINHKNDERLFASYSIEQKKQYLIDFNVSYFTVISNLSFLDTEKIIELTNFHHNFIVKNRYILDTDNVKEAMYIPNILAADVYWIVNNSRHPMLFASHIPSMKKLYNKFQTATEKRAIGMQIMSAYTAFYNYINGIAFAQQELQDAYLGELANFLLEYKELEMFLRGVENTDYSKVSWEKLRDVLVDNEMVTLMFYGQVPTTTIIIQASLLITPHCTKPVCEINKAITDITQVLPLKFSDYSNKRIYLSIIPGMEGYDLIYDAQNVHQKFNVYDLVRQSSTDRQLSSKYNNGEFHLFANIDYGSPSKAKIPPLMDGHVMIANMKGLYKDLLHVYTGDNVGKKDFLFFLQKPEMLHVSTHGIITSEDIQVTDSTDFYDAVMGNHAMAKTALALSKYNENPDDNCIHGDEIKLWLSFVDPIDLVYLDACSTGEQKGTLYWEGSLAKAFYFAGAKNVIAYLGPISEEMALEFSTCFYRMISMYPNKSYHDAFYETKKYILSQYKNKLPYDAVQKRPKLDVVLWE